MGTQAGNEKLREAYQALFPALSEDIGTTINRAKSEPNLLSSRQRCSRSYRYAVSRLQGTQASTRQGTITFENMTRF
jgi:hypothetical protein